MAECSGDSTDVVTKESIRHKVWKYLEDNNLACFPRPVYHRIPNFEDSAKANAKVALLDEFKKAHIIKVNPDKPQEGVRFFALEAKKTLLVPTPRLRSGLLNKIVPPSGCNKEMLRICAARKGIDSYSIPVDLYTKMKVDLVVTGCVAVSRKGQRIGKGEGYADLGYAIMSSLGLVDENTPVVTTVHDCQVFDELPDALFGDHDLPVDIIVTPTEVIRCEPRLPKPKGIKWSLLTPERLNEMPVLKMIRVMEKNKGVDVELNMDDPYQSSPKRSSYAQSKSSSSEERVTLYVGHIPHGTTVKDFKDAAAIVGVKPTRIYWKNSFAFIKFHSSVEAEEALNRLREIRIRRHSLKVDFSR